MKRNAMIAIGAALVAIVVLWYFVIYSPKADDLDKVQGQVKEEQDKTPGLESTLSQLQSVAKNSSQQQALLNKFDQAIPKLPDEAEFIVQMNEIATNSGVEFQSISPSPPAATGTTSTIALAISVQGSFFQVKNYLTQLESLDRLVIVDAVNIASGSDTSSTGGSSGTNLTVTLTARMFTRAVPAAAPGAAPAPGTTPPATGTDGSTSSSTAPGGATSSSSSPSSSTTGGT